MKKRIIALLSVLLLTMVFMVPVYATGMPYILDEYQVISSDDEGTLTDISKSIEADYGIQAVYICTDATNDLDNETYVAQISTIYGSNLIILLDNQSSGTIYLEAFGSAKDMLTSAQLDEILDVYNEADTYSGGVLDYLETLNEMLAGAGAAPDTAEVPTKDIVLPEAEAEDFTAEEVETEDIVTQESNPAIPEERQLPRLLDEADVLDDAEEAEVLSALDEISERQQFDVVIAFVDDYEQINVKNAAYDYYDYNGFGYGEEKDGVLLYISMAERELNIAGTGYGIEAFTDHGREMLLNRILPELGEDDYYAASLEFVELCDDYIYQARSGDPYDVHNLAEEETLEDKLMLAGIVLAFFLLLGAAMGKLFTGMEKRKLQNIQNAVHANQYVRKDSLNLDTATEYFLYRKVETRYNPKTTKSGGSTVDTGSSGARHSSTSSKF